MREMNNQSATPLVSVIIPSYNRADYIAETIESVVDQTYANREIIVIDDGSTDGTAAVVQPFTPHVRYVRQENAERGTARNHGLRMAKGEYIAFLDSDDLWLPRKLQEDVAFLEAHPEVGLVYTDALQIDAEGNEVRILRTRGTSGAVTNQLLERNFISIGTHLMRTSLAREIGGFREERALSGSEDWDFWVRLSLRTEFAYLPASNTKIRVHAANTMSNPAGMQRSMARALSILREGTELNSNQKARLNRIAADMSLANAINYCSVGNVRQSVAFLKGALVENPRIVLDPRFGYTILRLIKWLVHA